MVENIKIEQEKKLLAVEKLWLLNKASSGKTSISILKK